MSGVKGQQKKCQEQCPPQPCNPCPPQPCNPCPPPQKCQDPCPKPVPQCQDPCKPHQTHGGQHQH
ncbi:hypothetical protein XELAEV_18000662mg [Xenopus laevis]|nr:hypothetical protein XELAEV_18000659mg [Xenopus laevis]OCT59789.1 hypothetical protein XELAEV_18000662mg [Xenopus laevis]